MSNELQKKLKNESDLELDSKRPNKSRRSFAKAGIIAPVMLSLANRPAWGAVNHRCNVSGWSSVPVVGEGSGIPPNSDICEFSSASQIVVPNGDINTKINTLLGCPGGGFELKVSDVLTNGENETWEQNIVTAYYNTNNPFNCPVKDVYCAFRDGAIRFDFGNVSLTQPEVNHFLNTVLPLATF